MTTAATTAPSPFRVQKTRNLPLDGLIDCLPAQGEWTIEDYDFFASKMTEGPPLEYSHGTVLRKAMPSLIHAFIVTFLRRTLEAFVEGARLGYVFSEGVEIQCGDSAVRYPDVLFVSNKNFVKRTEKGFPSVDLVMEVLSPSNRNDDLNEKRRDYAAGGILEYWIVDPELERISILKLQGQEYMVHGVFEKGEHAASALLMGFEIGATDVLMSAR